MFQLSVLKSYLALQDLKTVQMRYEKFQSYFGDDTIQQNIRQSKESAMQGEFLAKLFGDMLGYTLNPNPNFNLRREEKNEINLREADGVILVDSKVRAVIELKDMKTVWLDKIEQQAFGYHSNHSHCHYVVASNFQKLRFYIDKTTHKIDFNLFELTREQFAVLHLCLSWESIQQDLPKKILEESIIRENDITRKFYGDYSACKSALWDNFCEKNPQFDKLTLFHKTQKLLDRILFILFAEDRGLLRANEVERIVSEWEILRKLDEYKPLYDRFKKYFGYLNTGNTNQHIFPYNGGLFQSDEILDTIEIDDTILATHSRRLAAYDFESDVDVNILGHIFEHSLTEIEEITAELTGKPLEKQNGRRKKDGIFYTPKYITSYIIQQTVGKLCQEKREELKIDTIAEGPLPPKKTVGKTPPKVLAQKKELHGRLESYRNWLLDLKICDPSCGSGAFLNQTLEFLITEHGSIDDLHKLVEYGGKTDTFIFADIETRILENNLYGVDINDESVEITKLSLWLRSAKKGHKLNDLSHRIKLGDSLIDDQFDWKKEFPAVFGWNAGILPAQDETCSRDGCDPVAGFDVIIGNPPYVQLQSLGPVSERLSKCHYVTFERSGDLYCLFYERGIQLLKPHGMLGFITSNKWLRAGYGESLRRFLTTVANPLQLVDFSGVKVFHDAVVDPHILILRKEPYGGVTLACTCQTVMEELHTFTVSSNSSNVFSHENWTVMSATETAIFHKMKTVGTPLKDLPVSICRGVLTGYDTAFYIDTTTKEKLVLQDPKSAEIIRPLLRGRDIIPYSCDYAGLWLICTFPSQKLNIDDYPAVRDYLLSFGMDRLKQTGTRGARKKTTHKWFEIQDTIGYFEDFTKPKIIYPNMTKFFPFMFDKGMTVANAKCYIITALNDRVSLEYMTAIFNSKLAKLWIWYHCAELLGGTREIRKIYFENFPVVMSSKPQVLAELAKRRTSQTAELQKCRRGFLKRLSDNFFGVKITKILAGFSSLSFGDFLKEMSKQKHPIPLKSQAEWDEFFGSSAENCRALSAEIAQTDCEIDRLVYDLYGLTDAEIAVVERQSGSVLEGET